MKLSECLALTSVTVLDHIVLQNEVSSYLAFCTKSPFDEETFTSELLQRGSLHNVLVTASIWIVLYTALPAVCYKTHYIAFSLKNKYSGPTYTN